MPNQEKAFILIPEDALNKGKEQFKIMQHDGVTYQIPVGKMTEVPLAVAIRAKEIGYIQDYMVK